MRTVWATVLSVWALFAVVAVLAWTRQQPPSPSGQIPGAVIVRGKQGQRQLVLLQGAGTATATHGTTRTSPVPAG
jgi:cyanate permease